MTKKMVIFREFLREWFGISPKSVTKKEKKEVLLGEGESFLKKGKFLTYTPSFSWCGGGEGFLEK